jgi:hypothetical protein
MHSFISCIVNQNYMQEFGSWSCGDGLVKQTAYNTRILPHLAYATSYVRRHVTDDAGRQSKSQRVRVRVACACGCSVLHALLFTLARTSRTIHTPLADTYAAACSVC